MHSSERQSMEEERMAGPEPFEVGPSVEVCIEVPMAVSGVSEPGPLSKAGNPWQKGRMGGPYPFEVVPSVGVGVEGGAGCDGSGEALHHLPPPRRGRVPHGDRPHLQEKKHAPQKEQVRSIQYTKHKPTLNLH